VGLHAYDDALAHEIWTYWVKAPGGHNSSFSPEDLCSNYLGTLVAARALAAGGAFVPAVEKALRSLLVSLDAQNDAETRAAFGLISHRWVDEPVAGHDPRRLPAPAQLHPDAVEGRTPP
jgi:hypothetical protein